MKQVIRAVVILAASSCSSVWATEVVDANVAKKVGIVSASIGRCNQANNTLFYGTDLYVRDMQLLNHSANKQLIDAYWTGVATVEGFQTTASTCAEAMGEFIKMGFVAQD